jgi:ATPase subunit of ABC transporter with duplicated ATPase domains
LPPASQAASAFGQEVTRMLGTLAAERITKQYAGRVVLDDVSVVIGARSRLGLVGPNGIGKTTLLRILAGVERPDSGRLTRAPAGLEVGYLPQEADAPSCETLRAYLSRRTGVAEAALELDRMTRALAADSGLVEAYSDALDRFLALGGEDLDARARIVCGQVGLPADRLDVPIGALSGGQAGRAALAAILLSRFDVLLLDEPTNDLDFAGLELLERFCLGAGAALVVVSHDRAFLDRVVDRILALEDGGRSGEHAGGWTEFEEARRIIRDREREAYERYVDERDRLREQARRQRLWADLGTKRARKGGSDPDKGIRFARVQGSQKMAARAKTTERRLERLEPVAKPWEPWRLRLELGPERRSGNVVARLEQAVVRRGRFQLGPVDLEVRWLDRVAIAGPNGSGKTTLLEALLGRIPLAEGRRYVGPGVVLGELDQRRRLFDPAAALLDSFAPASGLAAGEARTLLAKFRLGADEVLRPAGELSPGERTRASLALLAARSVNCLVLDEPTNHLDVEAIEELETALAGFAGTVLLVTHDRRFLERFEPTATVDLAP